MSATETEDDPRLALVYQEALRGLQQQQAAVESLHNRAATLSFASSFASSLLGPYNLSFRFDAQDLLDAYVDSQAPATMAGMHRDLALRIRADWQRNGRIVRRLREAFQLGAVATVHP